MPIDDPFQSNKTDCNKRLKTKDDLSYSRGMKRNMSVEEIQAKRPAINVIDIDSDDDDDDSSKNKNIIPEHVTNANNLESIVIKKEIKQEEAFEEGYIRDEELHDSTVVIVKSLIVPLRNISLSSSRSDIMNKSSKFRKAIPLKTPDFIELIPYKESTDCWTEKAAAIYVSDSSSEDDNWEFQQNHATSQKKIRSGK
ncbi:uncharacterized protein LOC142328769 [Lycorma delicatula]|uniref:uncharacterized protein LOC142328769 n=1 Tax=Lycorma delicatula TaxID=130591 RepID=UPI003F5130EF